MATRYIKLFETETNRQTYERSVNYQEPYGSGVVETSRAYYNAIMSDTNGIKYRPKNYIQATGYSSYALTPITGKSTDLIKIGFTITTRKSTGWCWIIGYLNSESDRFGLYLRNSSAYRWTVDFWRGGSGSSRKYADEGVAAPTTNVRYDFIVGNPSLSESNVGYAYNAANNTTIISETSINTTTSSQRYCVSENRSAKSGNVIRYYYVQIYKQQNGAKVLVLDWIPVQRVSDNVYGFYDNITKNFYPSNGGSAFSGG